MLDRLQCLVRAQQLLSQHLQEMAFAFGARQAQGRFAAVQHVPDLLGAEQSSAGTQQQPLRLVAMPRHLAWITVLADQGMQAHRAQVQYPNHLRPMAIQGGFQPVEIGLMLALVEIQFGDQGVVVSA